MTTHRYTHSDTRTLKATAGVLVVIQGICKALEHARVRHITQQDTVQERTKESEVGEECEGLPNCSNVARNIFAY